MNSPIQRGSVVWADLDPATGREQAGVRPAVVIASAGYLTNVADLVVVLPITTTDRGWLHHVRVSGPTVQLPRESFAMTEQVRTISRERITRTRGVASDAAMAEIDSWLRDFIDL